MNTKGITAFMDCMIFLVVVMMVISAIVTIHPYDDYFESDPEDFLSRISKTEVRLSDLTDLEDDTLVYLVDVMAYDIHNGSEVRAYLESILNRMFGDHRYLMTYEYEGTVVKIGDMEGFFHLQSSKVIRISTGNSINVTLGL
ncbi:MAG: hypothetical protein J5813_01090 [Candidatus Methanomethylophilaceae archaeon]|nr:hypothetical protein [Candidatus Methanomethylophilaceae archaeon]